MRARVYVHEGVLTALFNKRVLINIDSDVLTRREKPKQRTALCGA